MSYMLYIPFTTHIPFHPKHPHSHSAAERLRIAALQRPPDVQQRMAPRGDRRGVHHDAAEVAQQRHGQDVVLHRAGLQPEAQRSKVCYIRA